METTPTAEVLTEIGAPDPQGGGWVLDRWENGLS